MVPVGVVSAGNVSVSVPMGEADAIVRSVIVPGAKRCYQRELESHSSETGKLTVAIHVDASGAADSVTTPNGQGLQPPLVHCIVTVAKRAKFSAPGANGSTVSVPLKFALDPDAPPYSNPANARPG
jgi:hypothetical protein